MGAEPLRRAGSRLLHHLSCLTANAGGPETASLQHTVSLPYRTLFHIGALGTRGDGSRRMLRELRSWNPHQIQARQGVSAAPS